MRTSDGDRGDGRPIEEAWPDLANAPRSSRYQIYGLIGRGASGLVYRALDLTGHFPLALKSLKSATPEEIYHLKAEFRTLRDIYHPNLVQLFNLHVQDDHCYFTMELIDGQDFVSYARIPSARDDTQLDFEQLRPALRQLGEGLEALHRQGILHRDLKPTNVLVTAGGRTVLLDFGLSINTEAGADALSRSRVLAGTPSYMAPELFRAGQPTAASDWYGVGAILYEALTGRCPFPDAGPHFETFLAAKQAGAPDPSQLNGDVPDDLRDLTMALLEWDPSRRAGADEVARCTKQHAGESHVSEAAIVGRAGQHKFVGRVEELARLHGALEQSTTSEPMLALVSGEPGVGKTALIEQFISEVDDREDVLILRANCHAEEEVRYKAIDGLVDHLSHHLKSLDSKMLAQLTPASLPALTKVFPVLARVPFELPANYEEPSADPRINVNRAFVALRQILGRVASHRRTIIWIDDFQWADQASIDRLGELLGGLRDSEPRPGDASKPIALTVISYRAGEGRFEVADLLGQRRSMSAHTMIRLGPLSSEESRSLFSGVLDDGAAVPVDDVDDLSRQGAGLPLFIIELAGFVRERGPDSKADLGSNLNFDLILRQRLASLPEAQCKMLRLVALSPRPMPDDLLKLTIGPQLMGHETYSLCRQRLLRRRVADGWPAIETYHDRIRQAILAADTDEENRRGEHRLIAENLRVLPRRRYRGGQIKQVDLPMLAQHYESLLEHYRGAGDLARVSRYAIAAAKIASSRLAFDHAAGLLELALKHRRRG
ncbi:MAG: protein kinase domain-containing protein, partial [Gammaproteobacteria bacterium]